MAYACDLTWWQRYYWQTRQPLKLTVDKAAARQFSDLQLVGLNKSDDRLELLKPGTVGWGGNSGFHALNLAVQFMAGKIILVGYDMRVDHGLHWHGAHPKGMNNPKAGNVDRWRRNIDAAAETIAALGIQVINASAVSALQNYPKMTLREALEC